MLKLIAAISTNGVLGDGERMLWHSKEDFKFFSSTTKGHNLIMGRRTNQSIGRSLPGRKTWVVTSDPSTLYEDQTHIKPTELKQFLASCVENTETFFVCGGAGVYSDAAPFCSEFYITRVHKHVSCPSPIMFPINQDIFLYPIPFWFPYSTQHDTDGQWSGVSVFDQEIILESNGPPSITIFHSKRKSKVDRDMGDKKPFQQDLYDCIPVQQDLYESC